MYMYVQPTYEIRSHIMKQLLLMPTHYKELTTFVYMYNLFLLRKSITSQVLSCPPTNNNSLIFTNEIQVKTDGQTYVHVHVPTGLNF